MYIDKKKVILDINYHGIYEISDDLPIKVELSRKVYDRLVKDYGEYPYNWQIISANTIYNYIKVLFYSDERVGIEEILTPKRIITYKEYREHGIKGGDKNAKNKSKKSNHKY